MDLAAAAKIRNSGSLSKLSLEVVGCDGMDM